MAIWIDNGLEEVVFFFHTPTNALMPDLVSYFAKEMAKQIGIKVTPSKINRGGSSFQDNKLF